MFKRFSITPKFDFNLTKKWKIDYSAHYDLLSKRIVYHDITVYRDMHCWEMEFSWFNKKNREEFWIKFNLKTEGIKELKKKLGYKNIKHRASDEDDWKYDTQILQE